MVIRTRIATLMVHTSPLDQAGVGDAGGMNVYVVESAKKMAAAGVEVDIFTRANKPNLPESIEIADGVNVKHLVKGAKIQLEMDQGYSAPSAKIVTAGSRLYGLVEGELFTSYDMAAEGQILQAHLWSSLERQSEN
jgi:hypothetical protein